MPLRRLAAVIDFLDSAEGIIDSCRDKNTIGDRDARLRVADRECGD